jgi:hypothetical protein
VADIGGYLGLFLGLSVFSIFEIFETVLNSLDKKEDKKKEQQNGIGLNSTNV